MGLGHRVLFIGVLLLFALTLFAQISGSGDSLLPLDVLRPQYGEEPRFPTDYVIGELGRCDASEESYQLAMRLMVSLVSGSGKTAQLVFPEQKRLSALEGLRPLGLRSWRIGGGRVEPDGSVSYLVRFLGRERSITGELFLRREEAAAGGEETGAVWQLDDLLLESPRSLAEGKYSPGGADMTPYERFF
jgi:hypothetical protein